MLSFSTRRGTLAPIESARAAGIEMKRIDLVMIARDEARCIARSLHSVRALVDQMWVLDTGSADETVDIARACGARVAHFEWVDDFAVARNAALALSSADWRLVLDADEWLVEGGDALAALRTCGQPCIGQISVVSEFDDSHGGLQQAPSWLSRVLPQGVHYHGRVHEQPEGAWPRRRLDLHVLHDGYRAAQAKRKQGRNRALLLAALRDTPGDAYLQYQLGKDCELAGAFAEAVKQYSSALQRCARDAGWRHDLVLRQLFSLKQLARFEPALALASSEMTAWAHSPDFYFALGDVLLEWATHDSARAGTLLPMIESAWLRAIEIGEQPQLQDSVRGRGSYLAAHNLAVMHASLGRDDAARQWREREALMRA